MKVLSVRPPWSTLVAMGIKPVENRTWKSSYRGRLYIHSSQRFDNEGAKWICDQFPSLQGLVRGSYHPKGFIIGHVNMIDCVQDDQSEWFFGPYGFVFDNPVEFYREQWIPCRGKLGIFNVEGSRVPAALSSKGAAQGKRCNS